MNAVASSPSVPTTPTNDSPRSLSIGLAIFGALNVLGSIYLCTISLIVHRSFSVTMPLFDAMGSGTKELNDLVLFGILQAAVPAFVTGVFQLIAWRHLRAGQRYFLCCVALASLVLPWNIAEYVAAAFGLYALYRMTRPGVRQSFS